MHILSDMHVDTNNVHTVRTCILHTTFYYYLSCTTRSVPRIFPFNVFIKRIKLKYIHDAMNSRYARTQKPCIPFLLHI